MLALFCDRRFVPSGRRHLEMLNGFWGEHADPPESRKAEGQWRSAFLVTPQHIQLVSDPARAQFGILPADWKHYLRAGAEELAREFVRLCRMHRLRPVVLFHDDSDMPIPLDDCVILRTSLRATRRSRFELALPAWHVDHVEAIGGELPLQKWKVRPVVGFCGLSRGAGQASLPVRIGRSFTAWKKYRRWVDPLDLREEALGVIERDPRVEPRIVRRVSFYGGAINEGVFDVEALQARRRDFVENILESDYGLSIRGHGNYSFRLYETLCLGRIPLLIDTESVLPFENAQEWRDLLVRVPEARLGELVDRSLEFHGRNHEHFEELQRRCRTFWSQWLSPGGFVSRLADVLRGFSYGD